MTSFGGCNNNSKTTKDISETLDGLFVLRLFVHQFLKQSLSDRLIGVTPQHLVLPMMQHHLCKGSVRWPPASHAQPPYDHFIA